MIWAFDTETSLIEPGLLAPRLVCGSIATGEGNSERVLSADETRAWFRDWLASNDTIVGANIFYDLGVMAAEDHTLIAPIFAAVNAGRVKDVQIRQALDAIAKGHLFKDPRTNGPLKNPETGKQTNRYSLAVCCDITLDRRIAKGDTWRMRYARLEGIPLSAWPADALEYPKADARNTIDLYYAQESFENLHDETRQVKAAWALHLASMWGMRTDASRVAPLIEQVEKDFKASRENFLRQGMMVIKKCTKDQDPDDLDPSIMEALGLTKELEWLRAGYNLRYSRNTKAIQARVTAAYLNDPPYSEPSKMYPAGQVKTDGDTLGESGDDLLEALSEASDKVRTTFIPVLKQGIHVPINPSANVLVATGRTSYAKPNLQQIPRKGGIRECFIARPGYLYCSVDYSTLELRTLAQCNLWLFKYSLMAEALQRGEDLHTRLAADAILGVTYEEALKQVKAKNVGATNARQMSKALNFGFPGGMGAAKVVITARKDDVRFCLLSGIATVCGAEKVREWKGRACAPVCKACVETAEDLRSRWFKQWPEMSDYFQHTAAAVDGFDGGKIEHFISKRVRGACGFCDGCNTRFQGLAGDGAKDALTRLSEECYCDIKSSLYGSRPVVFVHDEIIAELPEDRAHDAAMRMTKIMVDTMQEYTPDIPQVAEPALMKRWYKGAEAVFSDQGKLIPWEPEVKKEAA